MAVNRGMIMEGEPICSTYVVSRRQNSIDGDFTSQVYCAKRQQHSCNVYKIPCGCFVCMSCARELSSDTHLTLPCPKCKRYIYDKYDTIWISWIPVRKLETRPRRHQYRVFNRFSGEPLVEVPRKRTVKLGDLIRSFSQITLTNIISHNEHDKRLWNLLPNAVLDTDFGIHPGRTYLKANQWQQRNILTNDSDYDCTFSDLTISDDSCIIANDMSNCKIKKFTLDGKLLGFLKIKNYPVRIDNVKDYVVVVSVQNCCKLLLIQHFDYMKIVKIIKTVKCYTAVACLKELQQFLCSTTTCRPSIDIIDSNGFILRMFSYERLWCGLKWPDYMTVINMWNVLISDMGNGLLISLDIASGQIKYAYKRNRNMGTYALTGVAIDQFRRIYVADRLQRDIICLSPDGVLEKVLLTEEDGICRPLGLAVTKSGYLVVAEGTVQSAIKLYSLY